MAAMCCSFPARPLILKLLLGLLIVLATTVANGQTALISAIDGFLATQTRTLPGDVKYKIAALDPRTQLGPCDAFEPFLPPGAKLWGKATIGVRCLGPSNWTVYVQVHIQSSGNYIVAAHAISAGAVISSADIQTRSGDITAFPATVATDSAQVIGKTARNGIFNGQPIRTDFLTTAFFVQQGQSVRTIAKGDGFSVSSEGNALNNAMQGQVVQVRTPSGQVVSGIATAPGVVEIAH